MRHKLQPLLVVALLCIPMCRPCFATRDEQKRNSLGGGQPVGRNSFDASTRQLTEDQQISKQHSRQRKHQSLVGGDRESSESVRPTSITSPFDYMSGKQDHEQESNSQQPGERPIRQQVAAETQPENHNQQQVALGREGRGVVGDGNMLKRHQADASDFMGPLIMDSEDNLAASNTLFEQPIAMQANGQEPVLASFYVNGLGGQQLLGVPQVMSPHNMNYRSANVPAQQYAGTPNDAYGAQQNLYAQQSYYTPGPSSIVGVNGFDQGYLRPQASFGSAINNRDPSMRKASKPRGSKTKQGRKERMLSDSQLNSLIDELKEFNRRQEKMIESRGLAAPRNKKASQSLRDDDNELGPFLSKLEEALDQQESEERSQKEENPSPEDLAKFARFLMTKEGANMRFQLGLDKDSPDDGDDEDDQDALLESEKKHTKARLKKKGSRGELEQFEKQNSEVTSQMDRLLKSVNKQAKEAKRAKRPTESTVASSEAEQEEGDSSDSGARKRRNHDSVTVHSSTTNPNKETKIKMPVIVSDQRDYHVVARGPKDNFAKSLIERELVEDKLELAQNAPITTGSDKAERAADDRSGSELNSTSKWGIQSTATDAAKAVKPSVTLAGEQGPNVVTNPSRPKHKRNTDHIGLIHELRQARGLKSDTRSKLPVSVIFNSMPSTNSDGVQSDKLEVGKAQLRAPTTAATVALNAPTKKRSSMEVSANDVGSFNDELVPALVEPDRGMHSVDTVQLQSVPLKDEYPISEKVSDRLNKLSHNLDRYFNDGFLSEIEAKSKFGSEVSQSADSQHLRSSNVNESTDAANNSKEAANKVGDMKVDHDFDIDVGIDGQRDADKDKDNSASSNSEEDGGEEDDDEREIDEEEKKAKGKDKIKANRRKTLLSGTRGNRRASGGKGTRPNSLKAARQVKHGESAVKFSLDPVESESLETPIGPD